MTIKQPEHCGSINEIRDQIDEIDQKIIELFAKRQEFVHEIVQFKTDEESVIALDRKNKVIQQRGQWAKQSGLDRELFSHIFKILIDHNIKRELDLLTSNQTK